MQVQLLLVQGQGVQYLGSLGQRGGLAHDHFLRVLQAEGGEVGIPAEGGVLLLQLVHGHLVVVGLRVAQLHAAAERLGQACLYVHHDVAGAGGGGIVIAGQLHHLHHVRPEGFADFRGGFVLGQVVIPFAH